VVNLNRKTAMSELKLSSKRIGRLYPILLDRHRNIIDGEHRKAADENWPKIVLEHIKTEEDRLLARLISNACRRSVSAGEKREILGKLGEIYLKQGVHLGKIANKIARETGMSYRWAMKYLPDNLKERPGLGGPSNIVKFGKSKVAHSATEEYNFLLSDPQEKIIIVKNYTNTKFVNIILEKHYYVRFEKIAQKFGVSLDAIINNALVVALKKLESVGKDD
jgi:hypothetical protein